MKSTRSLRRQLRALWVTNLVLFAAVCIAATPAVRPLLLDTSNHPTGNVDFASSHWTGDPTSGKAIAPASVTTPTINSTSGILSIPSTLSSTNTASNDLTIQGGAGNIGLNIAGGTGNLILGGGRVSLGNTMLIGWNTNSDGHVTAGPQIKMTDASSIHLYGTGGSSDGNLSLGNLTASGYLSFDGGAGYSDGLGDLTLAGTLTTSGGGYLNQTRSGGSIDTGNSGGAIYTSDGGGYIYTNKNSSPTDNTAPAGSLWMDQEGHNGHVLWIKETTGWVGK